MFGKTWGLKPKLAFWSYTTIARPRVTYASTVWWPKTEQKTCQSKLTKLQRLACLSVTSAMKTTPTAAMEAMLCILPLHLHVKQEAALGALRLQRCNNWVEGDGTGHSRIVKAFDISSLATSVSDCMEVRPNMDIPYEVIETNRQMWCNGGPTLPEGTIRFFTDGSKMGTSTGAGVFGPRTRETISMGKWPTVFQAEVYAIHICARTCIMRNYRHAKIGIFSDSQAALLALKSSKCESKLVWECVASLRELAARHNRVMLFWVPGHCGIEGNEMADELARQGSSNSFVGPEPFLGISKSAVKQEITNWGQSQIASIWGEMRGLRQAKTFITPSPSIAKKLLGLNRRELRILAGLLTGHCPARYHLHKIGMWPNNLCRFCLLELESSAHLLCFCGALVSRRLRFFGSHLLTPYDVWHHTHPKKVIQFIDCIAPNWDKPCLQNNPSSSDPMDTSNL